MPEFVIHEKPCLAHAASVVDTKSNSNLDQDSNQSKSMQHLNEIHNLQFPWIPKINNVLFLPILQLDLGDQPDDLSMFSVEEGDTKDVYPDVENALDCFNTGDALQQRNRGESNCNYDWADDIDVLNVLHSVNDWPVTLQVLAQMEWFLKLKQPNE